MTAANTDITPVKKLITLDNVKCLFEKHIDRKLLNNYRLPVEVK